MNLNNKVAEPTPAEPEVARRFHPHKHEGGVIMLLKFWKLSLFTRIFAIAVALFAFSAIPGTLEAGQDEFIEISTSSPYDKVVTAMKKAITSNKLVIVKEVPYTQMLSMVGVKADKSVGFEIFHPRYGKVIYAKDKTAMVEAPMRILVRETGGKVIVRYRKPSASLAGYSGLTGLGEELDTLFSKIVTASTK